jgi:diguanylate cyclase (GGDEF)-like protein
MTPAPLHFFDIHPFSPRLVFNTNLERETPWAISAPFEEPSVEENADELSDRYAKEAFDQVVSEDPALAEAIPTYLYERAIESIREDMSHIFGGMVEKAREGATPGDQMAIIIRRFASRIARRVCESLPLDPLTGLPNRGALDQRLKEEIARSDRDGHPLSLLMFDLDRFKEINDQYGHPKGDEVLRQLSHRFRHGEIGQKIMREYDFVARYGGDEMVFVLPSTDREGAIIAAHRITKALERDPIFVDNGSGTQVRADIGASIGIGIFEGKESDPTGEKMFVKADHNLLVLKGERLSVNKPKGQYRGQIAVNGEVITHEEVEAMIRSAEAKKAKELERAQQETIQPEKVQLEKPKEAVAPKRPFVFGPR